MLSTVIWVEADRNDDMQVTLMYVDLSEYWAIQQSWFARVNALCNLSRKKSREVAAHFRAYF